jgi:tetratricopeptide (TPR) repeat protein
MSKYWIFSPGKDLAFILLTPIPILLSFVVAKRGGFVDGLVAFGLAFAMAHYLPGILRAYGDRALFRRFRTRLIVAPVVLLITTTAFAYYGFHGGLLLALLWGQWHWMMQVYGFARIYDAKAPSEARTPARLDQMVCLLWFGMCAFVLNNDLPSYVTSFYQSGGPRLPESSFVWFTRAWVAATVIVTAGYAAYLVKGIREGRWPNPMKFVFIAVTFAYLSYTVSVVERPFMGLIMFEAWHDVQYLAIVWMFNLSRARGQGAGRFIQWMFRPRVQLAAAYILLCLAFGSLAHVWRLFENEVAVRIAVSVVTFTALLHYYLDGFIWKIREADTGQALGVRAAESAPPLRQVGFNPAWHHAALWLLFVVPALGFFVIASRGDVLRTLQIYESVARAFPNSAMANYQLARELHDGGRLREARVYFERAVELAPELLPARVFLGVTLAGQGDLAEARVHLEEAARLDPLNAEIRNNLGIVLDESGDLAAAKIHLERAVALNPNYALAENNLGIVLAKMGDLPQAQTHHERALAIDAGLADAHYQIGLIRSREGDAPGAATHFQQALRLDPNHRGAREKMASQDIDAPR